MERALEWVLCMEPATKAASHQKACKQVSHEEKEQHAQN